jgi:hypothetical protein
MGRFNMHSKCVEFFSLKFWVRGGGGVRNSFEDRKKKIIAQHAK